MAKAAQKTSNSKKSTGFTSEEQAAMKERAKELKAQKSKADGESDVLAKIAEMQDPDRSMATRLHEIIKANAPTLAPKTWYGMPAYTKNDKVVCHFQPAVKFDTRYATLGFSDQANLDDGALWPVVYAIKELTPAVEAKIIALLKQAVG